MFNLCKLASILLYWVVNILSSFMFVLNINPHAQRHNQVVIKNPMKKLEDSLTLQLLRSRESAMQFFRPILQETGFTEQQWRVIRVLNDNGQLDAKQLAERCCILSPSLTRIISRFESDGLIIRNRSEHDQRITLLSLSDKATEIFKEISPKIDQAYASLIGKLGEEKMQKLSRLLTEVTRLTP